MLLPIVLLQGIATYMRLVQINTEEFQLVLATVTSACHIRISGPITVDYG